MKKFILVLILLTVVPFGFLFAQEIPLYVFLPSITGDLQYLYPDLVYTRNPAVMLQFEKKMIIPNLYLYLSNTKDLYTRTNDLTGATGGTFKDTYSYINPDLGATMFFPVSDGNSVAGGRIIGDLYSRHWLDTYTNYNAATESEVQEDNDLYYGVTADVFYSLRLAGLDLGVIAGIYYYNDPKTEEYRMITNSDTVSVPYTLEGYKSSYSQVTPSFTIGTTLPVMEGTLGLAGSFSYSKDDWSGEWISVDKDGDTYKESIVTYEEYMTDTTWGVGLPFYEYRDDKISYTLTLSPSIILPVSDTMDFIASADWSIIDLSTSTSYAHTATTDKDIYVYETDKSLSSFDIVGGVSMALTPEFDLRIGGGYELDNTRRKVTEWLDVAGASQFEALNTDHYSEVNWVVEPDNNAVKWASVTGLADTEAVHTFKVLAGGRWDPAERVSFFSTASASFDIVKSTWYVFNNSNETIWTESEVQNDFDLDLGALVGVAVKVSDSFTLSIAYALGTMWGGFDSTDDELPQTAGADTANPFWDLVDTDSNYFGLNISCVLEL
jgi:hypothetical protein